MKIKTIKGKFALINIYKDNETILSMPENIDDDFSNRIKKFAVKIDNFCEGGSIYKTRHRDGTIFYNLDSDFLFTLLRARNRNHHLCFGLQETNDKPILMKLNNSD